MVLQDFTKSGDEQKPDVIRLLIADDHELVLDIARMYLDQQSDMDVTTAVSATEAFDKFQTEGPFDVVLLDYQMPGMDGLNGLAKILDLCSGSVPVGIITGMATRNLMDEVLAVSGAGIISKAQPIKSLANSIRFIHAGEVFLPLNLLQQEPEVRAASKGPLSGRELTVLQLLGDGNKNKQIATALGLSEGTVKMHVMSICKKLKATNRTHAVVLARDTGLL